ncbi:hypothetical protein H632_c3574p0, partial [Helicosporidium sp. ATCC 50920]
GRLAARGRQGSLPPRDARLAARQRLRAELGRQAEPRERGHQRGQKLLLFRQLAHGAAQGLRRNPRAGGVRRGRRAALVGRPRGRGRGRGPRRPPPSRGRRRAGVRGQGRSGAGRPAQAKGHQLVRPVRFRLLHLRLLLLRLHPRHQDAGPRLAALVRPARARRRDHRRPRHAALRRLPRRPRGQRRASRPRRARRGAHARALPRARAHPVLQGAAGRDQQDAAGRALRQRARQLPAHGLPARRRPRPGQARVRALAGRAQRGVRVGAQARQGRDERQVGQHQQRRAAALPRPGRLPPVRGVLRVRRGSGAQRRLLPQDGASARRRQGRGHGALAPDLLQPQPRRRHLQPRQRPLLGLRAAGVRRPGPHLVHGDQLFGALARLLPGGPLPRVDAHGG